MFNYAEYIVAITQQSAALSKAQTNGNKALMISIATHLTRLNAVLAHNLEKEMA